MSAWHRRRSPFDLGVSHYRIRPAGRAWRNSVFRDGAVSEQLTANSRAAASRLARAYSDLGIVGIVGIVEEFPS